MRTACGAYAATWSCVFFFFLRSLSLSCALVTNQKLQMPVLVTPPLSGDACSRVDAMASGNPAAVTRCAGSQPAAATGIRPLAVLLVSFNGVRLRPDE